MSHPTKKAFRLRLLIAAAIALLAAVTVWGLTWNGKQRVAREIEGVLRSSEFMATPATTTLKLHSNRLFSAADLIKEHPEVVPFLDAGLVEVRPGKVAFGKVIGARFALSEEGERASATGWRTATDRSGGTHWIVPTADKEYIGIENLDHDGDRAECDLLWRWHPVSRLSRLSPNSITNVTRIKLQRRNGTWSLQQ